MFFIWILLSEYHLRKYFVVCGFKLFTYSRTFAYLTSLQTRTVHFWMKLKSVQILFLNVHHLLFWLLGVSGYWSLLRTGAFCFALFWINNATSVKINWTADETLSHNLNNLSRSHSSLTSILISIAFNYKWFEELFQCSISFLNSINNVCDWITNNFVSYIQLNLWIDFSCLQEICSFESVFCWNWLNIASKYCSTLWITCNFCRFVSWICIKSCFFVE